MVLRLTVPAYTYHSTKQFGHEFRANEMVSDAFFLLSKKYNEFNFRVCLYCIVDYKGFRILANSMAPLDGDRTLVHGPSTDGIYRADL